MLPQGSSAIGSPSNSTSASTPIRRQRSGTAACSALITAPYVSFVWAVGARSRRCSSPEAPPVRGFVVVCPSLHRISTEPPSSAPA